MVAIFHMQWSIDTNIQEIIMATYNGLYCMELKANFSLRKKEEKYFEEKQVKVFI